MNDFITNVISPSNVVSIATMAPEILVGLTALMLLIGGVYLKDKTSHTLLDLGMFVLATTIILLVAPPPIYTHMHLFSGFFVADAYSLFVKVLLLIATFFALMLSKAWLSEHEHGRYEYPVLMLFSLLGMLLMVSANDFLALYVSIELMSLPLYVLASFRRDVLKSTESGIKYFVLGSLASGMLLFGISFIYGFTGTTNFEVITVLLHKGAPSAGIIFGVVMVIVAFCFKISAAPFHMWAPDVYEGAPTPVTAFFSTAPKVAAMALFIRVLVQPLGYITHDWQSIIVVVSAASMLIGALGALGQSNIKRLLAYSSIGHVGYALMGVAASGTEGVSSVLIYLTLYIFMSAGTFACVLLMKRENLPCEQISDLAGTSRTHPWLAFALSLFMFSMAGIPPLAGFFGKMFVFLAAINAGFITLAVIGVLTSVVACFYYLRIIKVMYFEDAVAPLDSASFQALGLIASVSAFVTLFFFVFPTPLIAQAHIAAEALDNKDAELK